MDEKKACKCSRYATIDEIQNTTVQTDFSRDDNPGGGIPFLSDGCKALVDSSHYHSLIVGSTGSGKTRRLILPGIFSMLKQKERPSIIIHDPKGELLSYTKEAFDEAGYRVHILNLKEMDRGNMRYNPLYIPSRIYQDGDKSKGIEMLCGVAESIFAEPMRRARDPFWAKAAQSYCSGLFINAAQFFPSEDINFDLIYSIHTAASERHMGDYLLNLLYNNNKDNPAWRMLSVCLEAATETKKSIYSEFDTAFQRLVLNRELIDICSGKPDVMPEDFFESEQPVVLFLVVNDVGTFGAEIAGLVVEQMYREIIRIADNRYKGVIPRRLEFVLDEFSTLPPFNDINQKISASRSRNVRFTFSIQSLQQLSYVYGKELSEIILGNVNNLLYMYSSDIRIHQYIEERSGIQITEYTGKERPLISAAELAHYEMGKVLIFHGRDYPFVSTDMPDISEYGFAIKLFDTRKLVKRKHIKQRITASEVFDIYKKIVEDSIRDKTLDKMKKVTLKRFGNQLALRLTPVSPGMHLFMMYEQGGVLPHKPEDDDSRVTYFIEKDDQLIREYVVAYTEERSVDHKREGLVLYYLDIMAPGNRKREPYDTTDIYVALYDPNNVENIKKDDKAVTIYPLKNIDEQKTFKSTELMIAYLEGIISHIQKKGL